MSNRQWRDKWKRNDIGFHQPTSQPLLKRFIPHLQLAPNALIAVPLCGKSHDMNLLSDLGYRVMGIELSTIAVRAFFDARNVNPSRTKRGKFTVWSHGNIEIWCGDIFDLDATALKQVSALYDCTALTAFATGHRPRYVAHFHRALPPNSQILLITTESSDTQPCSSASEIDSEVRSLYERHYALELLHRETSLLKDPERPGAARSMMDEKVYRMVRSEK